MSSTAGIIFDLDDTLVDTSMLADDRQSRKWGKVISRVDETVVFEEALRVFDLAKGSGLKIGVVTRSISNYAKSVLKHHRLEIDSLIAYHDCKRQKPHPDPVLLCIKNLGVEPSKCIGIGDSFDDSSAYKAATVLSVGALWSPTLQNPAQWDAVMGADDLVRCVSTRLLSES